MNFEDIPRDKRGKAIADQVRFPVHYRMIAPLESSKRDAPVEALELREPTAGEVEIANRESAPTAAAIRMVSMASGLSTDEVRSMGMRDYLRLNGLLLDFS